ncbi:RimK family alpha-L-glutamate ligase [Streptomyces sp. NPDC057445]|uniref:ATP-grasp domain-containing protein n=1 Tax=Streptomyces sp. NPDC057445 TaxID=3346136 RepID=UPI0036BC6B80
MTELVWITCPDNYDPVVQERLRRAGSERVDLLRSRGFDLTVVHANEIVPAWNDGPRLWQGETDLLSKGRGFILSSWTWDAGAGRHLQAIARTIRASDSVLLNDGIKDPEALGNDKLAMYHHAGTLGIPVLPSVSIPFGRYARRALATVSARLDGADGYLVKPREMAMGYGVLKADTFEQLTAAIDLLTPGALGCIVQPFRPNSGDVRVYVHNGTFVAALLREPAEGSYLANVSEGGTGSALPGEVPAEVSGMSERLARSLDAPYLCVDWLLSPAGPVLNEWMTISAAYEDLPEPQRSRVEDALIACIGDRLKDAGEPAAS